MASREFWMAVRDRLLVSTVHPDATAKTMELVEKQIKESTKVAGGLNVGGKMRSRRTTNP